MNHCPCNNCICVPICKEKQYQFLVQECELIWNYLIHPLTIHAHDRKNGRLKLTHKALQPTQWQLFYDEHERVMVDNYTGYAQCHFYY